MKELNKEEREFQLSELQEVARKFSENMSKFRAYERYPLKRVRDILKLQSNTLFFVLNGICQKQEIENLNNLIDNLLIK